MIFPSSSVWCMSNPVTPPNFSPHPAHLHLAMCPSIRQRTTGQRTCSFVQVAGPVVPSALRPAACWKAVTAALVAGP